MNILESAFFEKGIATGVGVSLALGVGILILAPAAASIAGSILRPVAKTVIKGGIIAYDQARNLFAETRVATGGPMPESKPELSKEQAAAHRNGEVPSEVTSQGQDGKSLASEEGATLAESEPERTKPWIVRGY